MGPSISLVILMFVAIAAALIGSFQLTRGWKSSLVLFAVYAAGLTCVSMSPQLIAGQVERAALGLAWVGLVLAGIVRAVVLIVRGFTARKTTV